jgi:hypothetical protein
MSYPYSSLFLETRKAQLKLAFVFQAPPDQHPEDPRLAIGWRFGRTRLRPSPGCDEDIPTSKDQQPAANRRSASLEIVRRPGDCCELRRNAKSPGRPYWMREDMGAHSFAWTLLLLGTFAAAQTDQPVLWLLIGPAPFVVGYTAVAFLRQKRFDLSARLRGLRQQGGESGLCQCQYRPFPL